jgi:hypothetical protein
MKYTLIKTGRYAGMYSDEKGKQVNEAFMLKATRIPTLTKPVTKKKKAKKTK